jgi:hypothetical protein
MGYEQDSDKALKFVAAVLLPWTALGVPAQNKVEGT